MGLFSDYFWLKIQTFSVLEWGFYYTACDATQIQASLY